MIRDPEAAIILDAITLHGIGSYLSGARLDIRPLTILCGPNGSGKSTWLKVLNMLKESVSSKRLPFGFTVEDWDPRDIQLTNAFYHLADPAPATERDKSAIETQFGRPGTIGLEIHASRDQWLAPAPREADERQSAAWNFLWAGQCKEKCPFRIRLAHPTHWADKTQTPDLAHLIELEIDGVHIVRMEGERDPLQKFVEGTTRPRRERPYALSCSLSLLNGAGGASDVVPVATITDLNSPRFENIHPGLGASDVAAILDLLEGRVRDLVARALDGYFYIGAVRRPMTDIEFDDANTLRGITCAREVGPGGEFAWLLENYFGDQIMRRIAQPEFTANDIDLSSVPTALTLPNQPKLERIRRCMSEEQAAYIENFEPPENAECEQQARQSLADALNGLLNDRGLYDEKTWAREKEITNREGDTVGFDLIFDDPDIQSLKAKLDRDLSLEQHLGRPAFSEISPDELRLLNYLLILDAFRDSMHSSGLQWLYMPSRQQCTFNEYVSAWLSDLVDVGINPKGLSRQRLHQWSMSRSYLNRPRFKGVTPYLVDTDQEAIRKTAPSVDEARISHPCFGDGFLGTVQPPRQLSAGFHQLFPVIVQLGLLKRGELLGIENPEVHLHPSLQMKITEALLAHVISGRRVIVETHSDLVLRRVIRAILEEEIGQSQIHIYFTSLDQSETISETIGEFEIPITFRGSSLTLIQVDEEGTISNWPNGFLDDDVRESQRLIDIMYGRRHSSEDTE